MELKNKGSDVAVTTGGAIEKSSQRYSTNDSYTDQGPKHITFTLSRAMELIAQGALLEDAYD